jgi:Rad3-related DNA helicase
LRSAVLTSATLTVAGRFDYLREALGLQRDLDVRERVFPSPFDYRRQAVLVLESDPSSRATTAELPPLQAQQLERLTDATGGRLLALFTNTRQMQEIARQVGAHAERGGVLVLAQGLHGSAAALADEFRSHPSTVLLGVDTLWTGQDFPGDVLVCLAIAKLPFGRQDPLYHARRTAAEQEGRDWFGSFYLPEAILKFRQGFGRLIRTESDYGVVTVLDPRLPRKRYVDQVLASLPELEVVEARPDELAGVVRMYLERLERADTSAPT